MRKSEGFTLIELMVVIAIIGIIATIAVPSFNEQVHKSRRSEAMQALSELQLRQEKWRSNRANYLGTNSAALDISAFGSLPTSEFYTITITSAASPTGYTLSAAPAGGQVGDKCGTFTLTNAAGTISKTVSTGRTDCW